MKERPILFNGPMVRAILEGRKTQTRRIIKPQPEFCGGVGDENDLSCYATKYLECEDGDPLYWDRYLEKYDHTFPYGKVGDRLWVRETVGIYGDQEKCVLHYKADRDNWPEKDCGWTPSIHMPRWASRITLEITGVRIERMQEGGDREFWGEEKWAENPWVWVIEFKRVEKGTT